MDAPSGSEKLVTTAKHVCTSALSVLEEQVTLASTSTAAQPRTASVLESVQGRQVGRLKPELVDKQGRIMLKPHKG